jgi:hypothetical protein
MADNKKVLLFALAGVGTVCLALYIKSVLDSRRIYSQAVANSAMAPVYSGLGEMPPQVDMRAMEVSTQQTAAEFPQVPEKFIGNVLVDFRNVPVTTTHRAGGPIGHQHAPMEAMVATAEGNQPLYTPVVEQRELPMLEKTF